MLRRIIFSWTLAIALFVAGCSKDSSSAKIQDMFVAEEGNLPGLAENTGCIQGTTMSGITQERIPLQKKGKGLGIYVSVQSKRFYGMPVSESDRLKGDYYICGVPLDEKLPIFVDYENYQLFEGEVFIPSRIPTGNEKEPFLKRARPFETANIRLFPYGVDVRDFLFEVVSGGKPVVGANVRLIPVANVDVDSTGRFLAPVNVRNASLNKATDEKGFALFPSSELVLGGAYQFIVLPPEGVTNQVSFSGRIQVGLNSSGQAEPYKYSAEIQSIKTSLSIISSNITTNDYYPGGTVSYVFNRPIEIVPGTEEEVSATLVNYMNAELVENVYGNQKLEQVSIQIDGNKLSLSPVFAKMPDSKRELALKIRYSGLVVRPKEAPNTLAVMTIPDAELLFFGGKQPRRVPREIVLEPKVAESAVVRSDVNVTLKVVDQFGYGLPGQTLFFNTASAAEGTPSSSSKVTDDKGFVTIYWSLGAALGPKTLQVIAMGLEPVKLTVNAIADAPRKLLRYAGDDQNGVAGSALSRPVQIQVLDAYNNPIAGAAVRLSVSSGGGRVNQERITSDVRGIAEASWILGGALGDRAQKLYATIEGSNVEGITFLATARAADVNAVSVFEGNSQKGTVGIQLPNPIVVKVTDAYGNPISGAKVNFKPIKGSVSSEQVVTDAYGKAASYWRLDVIAGAQSLDVDVVGREDLKTTFTATGIAGAAAQIGIYSGNQQTAEAQKTLKDLIVAQVKDSYGNPVENDKVTTTIVGGGSVTPATATSDANGLVKLSWTLGAAGDQILKVFNSASQNTNFTATIKKN